MNQELAKKLKIEQFQCVCLLEEAKEQHPFDYIQKFNIEKEIDLAIGYCYNLEQMKNMVELVNQEASENCCLYILYPKTKNILKHIPIARDSIFPYLNVDEESGYVSNTDMRFNKMLALDENYTLIGLKKQTNYIAPKRGSQKVADYFSYIEELVIQLDIESKKLYLDLSKGYQKDWVRYVYSSVKSETQRKRIAEMQEILKIGFKTKQLYRDSLKK